MVRKIKGEDEQDVAPFALSEGELFSGNYHPGGQDVPQPRPLFAAPVHQPQGEQAQQQGEHDVPMEAEQEIIGVLRQTGKDQQPQGVPVEIPGVPVTVGDGEQEDGGGDASYVIGAALEHLYPQNPFGGVGVQQPLQRHGQGPDIGEVVPQHGQQGDDF